MSVEGPNRSDSLLVKCPPVSPTPFSPHFEHFALTSQRSVFTLIRRSQRQVNLAVGRDAGEGGKMAPPRNPAAS